MVFEGLTRKVNRLAHVMFGLPHHLRYMSHMDLA